MEMDKTNNTNNDGNNDNNDNNNDDNINDDDDNNNNDINDYDDDHVHNFEHKSEQMELGTIQYEDDDDDVKDSSHEVVEKGRNVEESK